jgi:hypothetical protein
MPSGTDIITWSPRVGASGDDRYDPGEARVAAGTASGTFSDPPTLAQVNAATGMNQVVAEILRRCWGSSPASTWLVPGLMSGITPSWFPTSGRIKQSGNPWDLLKSDIDDIRTCEELSAYSWSGYPTITAGERIARETVLHLRKALATDQLILYRWRADHIVGVTCYGGLKASTSPYPTIDTVYLNTGAQIGELSQAKRRGYLFFRVPSSWPSGLTGDLRCTYTRGSGVRQFQLYRATSHLGPIDTGDWGNIDDLEYEEANDTLAPSASTPYRVDMEDLADDVDGGSNYTYIAVHEEEIDDTDPGSSVDAITAGAGGAAQPCLVLETPS